MSPMFIVRNVEVAVAYDEDFDTNVKGVATAMNDLGKPVVIQMDEVEGTVIVSGGVASHVADAVDMLTGDNDVELAMV